MMIGGRLHLRISGVRACDSGLLAGDTIDWCEINHICRGIASKGILGQASVRSIYSSRGRMSLFFNDEQKVFCFDLFAYVGQFSRYFTAYGSVHRRLHFHCFEHQEPVAFFHLRAHIDRDARYRAGNWRPHLTRLCRIGLRARRHGSAQCMIPNIDFARLAVQLEKDRPRAIRVRIAYREKFYDERFSGLDFDGNLHALIDAIKELRRRKNFHASVSCARLRETQEDIRIHQIAH